MTYKTDIINMKSNIESENFKQFYDSIDELNSDNEEEIRLYNIIYRKNA